MTTEVDKITKAPKQNELIDTVNKIIDNLGSGGITVDDELSTTSENPVQNKVITGALEDKQDVISDLSTIRSGASKGATAVQPNDLATVATSGSYNDLTDKPTIPDTTNFVTTNTAQNITGTKSFVGGNKIILKQDTATSRPGFIITDPNANEVGSLQYRPNAIGTNAMLNLNSPGNTYLGFRYWGTSSNTYNLLMPLPSIANNKFTAGNYYFPLGFTDGTNTVLTDNSGMVDISTFLSNFVSTGSLATTLTDYAKLTDLSAVATSGSYNDLLDKPTIPSAVTESTVSGWGFTKNTGTVTSVNNVQPDSYGNVTLSIPEQVQANWNETDTTSKAYIQNKPNLSTVATSGSYNDLSNKPTIPTVDQSFDGTSINAESGVSILGLLQTIYPVGSVYLSTNSTCPLASLFGTWILVSSGKALWTGTGSNGGTTISAGLPNITGNTHLTAVFGVPNDTPTDGAFKLGTSLGNTKWAAATQAKGQTYAIGFDASRSNSIYGNSTTVQPPAYVVNVWRRTA